MTTLPPPVPHPGSRPPDLVFPFAEARAALRAIEGEVDDLTGCARDHEHAAVEVCQGFEGRSRDAFDARLSQALAQLAVRRQQLADDADQLRHLLAEAARRDADRQREQQRWATRLREYEADRARRSEAG
jgi:hypothetical protein